MESSKTWVLLVDDQHRVIGNPFSIITSGKDDIEYLTVKVKEYWQEDLAHVNPSMLTVWRFSKKAPAFEFEDLDTMQRLVSEAFSKEQVTLLRQHRKITNLNISEDKVERNPIEGAPAINAHTSEFILFDSWVYS